MNKIKNAFTLLELLVVIGIIGILVALATVSYGATQKSGRDSRRKQDMVAIQNALEQYYSASPYYKYPDGVTITCPTGATTYMKSAWPADPDGTVYSFSTCGVSGYCICATMEKAGSGNSVAACSWGGTKTHYCVGNLQ